MPAEPTDFLYPFIEGDERDADALVADLAASAAEKQLASHRLRTDTVRDHADELAAAAQAIAARLGGAAPGVLYVFGNGGSATDALRVADELAGLADPRTGRAVAARALVAEPAVLTALANDVGVDVLFSRQLIAHDAGPGDVALGLSTSGSSTNVLRALAEGRQRGMLTIGLAGYDGGAMAASSDVDHCFVVRSDSVHRIQEAQAALTDALRTATHRALDAADATR